MKELLLKRDLHVLVGMPSQGSWAAAFGMSMLQMMTYFMQHGVPGWGNQQLQPFHIGGSTLSNMRWSIVKKAIQVNASHVLFVDSDQSFPRDLVHKLLAHKVDVVAANVATKKIPSMPTARYRPKDSDPGHGTPCFTDDSKKGIERVWRVGTGVMLVRTKVFKDIVEPLFEVRFREEAMDYQGEDWSMVECFERAGVDIWVDHDVSKDVGHWGPMCFTHDMVGEVEIENRVENILRANASEAA